MAQVELEAIADGVFRANPSYDLIAFDQLPAKEQHALRHLQKDETFYGILYPRGRPELGVKSVSHEAASLFLRLKTPGRVPANIKTLLGEQYDTTIAQLVFDGILELDFQGRFVSGPESHRLMQTSRPRSQASRTAELSLEALRYAQALDIDDSRKLSARLYFYGRQPASPAWKRRLPTAAAVAEYLGTGERGAAASFLAESWTAAAPSGRGDTWLTWRSRDDRQAPEPTGQLIYKLYVSPEPEFMRRAFPVTVQVLSRSAAWSFKAGGDVYGLLRPDKMVAYFSCFEELQDAAHELTRQLRHYPAHGVPFTADLGGDGMLSWGIDPPLDHQMIGWRGPESWRLWVTNRLAVALVSARSASPDGIEPWEFALDRLRLEGVDTVLWSPAQAWLQELAGSDDRP